MQSNDMVVVVTPSYLPEQSEPNQHRYLFSYHVQVRNNSAQAAQLISRHWVITDAEQNVQEVKGLGVVGKQPLIGPGEVFEYSSGCPLPTPFGTMKGSFHFVGENGVPFDVRIDEFVLSMPRTLH
ncbi:ApaG protein [Paenalcaligenes hominis]|uniref:Protein ApaG n=1 Tax=Paenalcaligenes hominis TaxID=643674 RepID=A0ABX0WQ64_9BURK|nr:Co2+/Mg2+ efflux protein ApaG [Paenalcaligenes hominis]NJB65090.1 ApaG protein [Paenalcaligenes hominis]GGE56747.1 protein ApaG [Paenalcaligenes hominis]